MESNNKLKIIIGALAVILVLVLVFLFLRSSKKSGSDVISIKYWGYQDEEKDIKPLIDAYKEKHSNVSIIYKKIEESPTEYEKSLNDALASGEGPDIFQIRNDWVPKYYKKVSPVPDSAYKKEDYNNTFFEIAQNDLTYKDQTYAIPFYLDTLVVFYNNAIFDQKIVYKVPDTWEEFTNLVIKLRNLSGNYVNQAGIAMGTGNNIENAQDILYLLMLQKNTKMVSNDLSRAYFNVSVKDKNGKITYPGTEALDFYLSFADPSRGNYTWNTGMPNSFDAFTQGKTAMVFGYASDIRRIEKATNGKLKFDAAPMPQFLGNKTTFPKYWANVVNKSSQNEKTCWEFLKFASSKDQMKKYLNSTGMPTSRKDIAEFQEGKRYLDVFGKQIKDAKSWYKGDWEKIDKIFLELINDVIINKQPHQAALDSAAKKTTDVLEEFKKREE